MKPSWATTKLTLFDGAAAAPEHVARAGDPGRDLAAQSGVAAPEAAGRVAKAVVPFGERRAEAAELVAARADVPWLGDQRARS